MRTLVLSLVSLASIEFIHAQQTHAVFMERPPVTATNKFYTSNRAPLAPEFFIKLPVTAFQPGGWLRRQMELQCAGLTGNLDQISIWLSRKDNAWLNKEGKGEWGWEELPYWLKGYANLGYMLRNDTMISKAKFWIDAVLSNQRENGDFGPAVVKGAGKRDLWTNMPMLWCLQSWYEYSGDSRVVPFMLKYFKWQLTIPDELFLEDYWEKSRGGDNLVSVYWLYNLTGESWLLDLATKIDRNTADWRQPGNLPNWHNVNIAQCFREPATYAMQSHKQSDMDATYNNFRLIRKLYGQVPGGMFGADENARKGYDDPRQAIETCGMVEQMTSNHFLTRFTGDPTWADNSEDVAFNSFPAAFMPDYRSLRYLTAPNMVISDSRNHAPGIANEGPFLTMNPFSSRCCQHNHAAGWVYYAENTWTATADNGIAAQLYTAGTVTAKVGDGVDVTINEQTNYPFEETVGFHLSLPRPATFPLYLRLPGWVNAPVIKINGKKVYSDTNARAGYLRLEREWKNGDIITLALPMEITWREWTANKHSQSVNYGPLTFSLKIDEANIRQDSKATAIGDSRWQADADTKAWPSFEIHPASAWNYGLQPFGKSGKPKLRLRRHPWPADNNPFTAAGVPMELETFGRKIPGWGIDQYGLCDTLPMSPVATSSKIEKIRLIPMGAARLRIASFPMVKGKE